MRAGFTLAEVLMALIILELGLLGVVGLALHAHRLMNDASLWSRAAAVSEEVADSLAVSGARSGGSRSFPGGSVVWSLGAAVAGGGGRETLRRISIRASGMDGEEIFVVRGVVPRGGPSAGP